MSNIRYFASGVDKKMFQCSFSVVKYAVGVDTGPS